MDFSKFKNGDRVPVTFSIIGIGNKPIAKSSFKNEGKWNVQCIGHPTSGTGNIAMTENELGILAGKLGLSSWKSLLPVLNKGVVKVETQATFNKKGAPYKDQHGVAGKYEVDHLRFNVNDYLITPDAAITTFVETQQSILVTELERAGVTSAVETSQKQRQEILRKAAGLTAKTEAEI